MELWTPLRASIIFWSLLLVPGAAWGALLGRPRRAVVLLPGPALALLYGGLHFILVSQLAYLLRAPFAVILGIQLAPCGGLLWRVIWRRPQIPDLFAGSRERWIRARGRFALLLRSRLFLSGALALVAAAVVGLLVTGQQGWDSGFHLTCVRFLHDRGVATPFQGFFKDADRIDPAYAFNPGHLLLALVAWASRTRPLTLWLAGPFILFPASVYAAGLLGRALVRRQQRLAEVVVRWAWLGTHAVLLGRIRGSTHPFMLETLAYPRGLALRLAAPIVLALWLGGRFGGASVHAGAPGEPAGRRPGVSPLVLFGLGAASAAVVTLHRQGVPLCLFVLATSFALGAARAQLSPRQLMIALAGWLLGAVAFFLPAVAPLRAAHAFLLETSQRIVPAPLDQLVATAGFGVGIAMTLSLAVRERNRAALVLVVVYMLALVANTVPPLRALLFAVMTPQYTVELFHACNFALAISVLATFLPRRARCDAGGRPANTGDERRSLWAGVGPRRAVVLALLLLVSWAAAGLHPPDLGGQKLLPRLTSASRGYFADAERTLGPMLASVPPGSTLLVNDLYASFWVTPQWDLFTIAAHGVGRGVFGTYSVPDAKRRQRLTDAALSPRANPIWVWQVMAAYDAEHVLLTPADVALWPQLAAFPELFESVARVPTAALLRRRSHPEWQTLAARLDLVAATSGPTWDGRVAAQLAAWARAAARGLAVSPTLPQAPGAPPRDYADAGPNADAGSEADLEAESGVAPVAAAEAGAARQLAIRYVGLSPAALEDQQRGWIDAATLTLPLVPRDLRQVALELEVGGGSLDRLDLDLRRRWAAVDLLCVDPQSGLAFSLASLGAGEGEAPTASLTDIGSPCARYRLVITAAAAARPPQLEGLRAFGR